MSKQRLHPIAIFFNLLTGVKEFYFAIILGLITFRGQSLFYFSLVLLAMIVLLLLYSFFSWYRFTYQIDGDELQIEHGIFIRKQRYISKNRIQSIDLTASVVHRLFKLVKVQVDTASSGDGAEASLSAVKASIGEQLRSDLMTREEQVVEPNAETIKEPTFKISFKQLFLAGSTSGSIGVILAIAIFGLSEVEQFIPNQLYDQTFQWIVSLSIVIVLVLIIIGLLILWLLGIAGTMIKYGNFTIVRREEELYITRGLLEKREQTIPLRRIQAVGIKESIIRQPLGYVTVYAEVAGGSLDAKEDFNILFPIMKKSEVDEFLQTILPNYANITEAVNPLPKRARKFYLLRSIAPILLFAVIIFYLIPQFSWLTLILLVGFIALGILRYQDGGYQIIDDQLTVTYRGMLSKTTVQMYKNRIQSFEKSQHKIQQVQKLATMQISIIGVLGLGTHYTIKDMDEADVLEVANWYSYRSKAETGY